jgi:hypothetical protein
VPCPYREFTRHPEKTPTGQVRGGPGVPISSFLGEDGPEKMGPHGFILQKPKQLP